MSILIVPFVIGVIAEMYFIYKLFRKLTMLCMEHYYKQKQERQRVMRNNYNRISNMKRYKG